MTQIGSYNSPIKLKDGELIIKGKVQANEEFKAPLVISHEFETSPLTGTISATTHQVLGVGTKFKSELSTNDYIVVNGVSYGITSIPTDTMMFVHLGQTTQFTGAEFEKLTNPLEGGSLLELKYGGDNPQSLFKISPDGDVILPGEVQSDRVVASQISATTLSGELVGAISNSTYATTQSQGNSSTKIATTEFVKNEIAYGKTVSPRIQGFNSDASIQSDIDVLLYSGGANSVLTIEADTNVSQIKVINRSTTGDVTFAAGDGVTILYGGTGKLPNSGTDNRQMWSCTLIEDPYNTNSWIITDLYTGF